MKLRGLLFAGLAGLALSLSAQTHEQGIEYYKADQFNNAQELLQRNLNNPGTDKALSYYYLGQIEILHKDLNKARDYFNKGVEADPQNPYNYVGLGSLALKAGDAKGAEKYFKEAESRGKKDLGVQADIARAYYDADPVLYKDKYEKRIENALKKDVHNADINILYGDIYRDLAYQTGDKGDYGKAAAKYDFAKNANPNSSVAYVKYADMYTNANNPDQAIGYLEELLRNNPNSALGQRQLANLYYDNGYFSKAADLYGKYVNNPNHFKNDEDRYAFILYYGGDYQKGYDYATKLLGENPNNFSAKRFQLMNASKIESMKDNRLQLAENLLAAQKANPADNKFAPIDFTLIAKELSAAGRPDEAITVLQEGTRAYPADPDFYSDMADVYIDAEDYGKAADSMDAYLGKKENPSYYDYLLGSLYAYFGGNQASMDILDDTTGAVIRPKDLQASKKYLEMAKKYANKGKQADAKYYKFDVILGDVAKLEAPADQFTSAAVPMYESAVVLLEADQDRFNAADAKKVYKYLGRYYYDNKDNAKALPLLNKYLQLAPEDTDYQTLVNSIK